MMEMKSVCQCKKLRRFPVLSLFLLCSIGKNGEDDFDLIYSGFQEKTQEGGGAFDENKALKWKIK